MRTLLALDLETTGLDPDRDAVIEIGAVRFRGSRVEDEWQSLINPGRPIPPFITQLTGIDDTMVAHAPRMTSVLNDFKTFVGDLPILGHNVGFDLGFLRRKGLFELNESLDTYDMAAVLLPSAGSYSLSVLAGAMGLPVATAHRALTDAQTTRGVYLALFERCSQLPGMLVEEIARLGAETDWGAGWLFEEALRDKGQKAEPGKEGLVLYPRQLPPAQAAQPLSPNDRIAPLDAEELASLLEPGGILSRAVPGYEHRSQQVTMLRAVSDAFTMSHHLLVEAATGTGKSMAYLVPALAWAEINGRRVVVSTNTINLQEQLIHKDIPHLQRALGSNYRAAVLKGRGNYLCPRRLAGLRQIGPRSAEEMRVLAKILVWLHAGGAGDRGELSLGGPAELSAWSRLSAETEDCNLEACQIHAQGRCPYFQARKAAEAAHVLVVNHALLLADVGTGSRVIPEYRYLVIDEAHHLEEATTKGLSIQVTEAEVVRLLKEIGGRSSGVLARVLDLARHQMSPGRLAGLRKAVTALGEHGAECVERARSLFAAFGEFLEQRREGKPLGPYGQQERLLPSTRTLAEWGTIEAAWEEMQEPMSRLIRGLNEVAEEASSLDEPAAPADEALWLALRGSARGLLDVHSNLNQMISEPASQMVYWIEAGAQQGRLSLHAAPLEVGSLVERFLWNEKESVVMTSATLTTASSFDYIRGRLNAREADELALGSPFDYESSTLLYLVNDIPDPNERAGHQRALERTLVALCRATGGRTLVLFTSYEQMRRTAQAIGGPLASSEILVFEQGEGVSRYSLLESFRTTERAVLLGTRSFWEGVDVPGEALSVLVIVKLPFDVPSDPIVAARAETFESPFAEYSVPEAILRFRQGFGRLIRTRSDRGVVVALDRRILTKTYGRAFLDSLPTCTLRTGPAADLPAAAARWLGL